MERNLGSISIRLLKRNNEDVEKHLDGLSNLRVPDIEMTVDGLSNLCVPVANAEKRLKDAMDEDDTNEIRVYKDNLTAAIDNLRGSLFDLCDLLEYAKALDGQRLTNDASVMLGEVDGWLQVRRPLTCYMFQAKC